MNVKSTNSKIMLLVSTLLLNASSRARIRVTATALLWVIFCNFLGTQACADELVVRQAGSKLAIAEVCRHVGSCPKQRMPYDWTPEERAQFIEALNRYPKWQVPKLWPSQESKVFWLDDVRVLMSVRELPSGWKAAEDEKSKIVAINTDTREIEETPYRGDLVCYSSQRMIVSDYPRPYLTYRKPGDSEKDAKRHLAGRFGEQLQPVEWPKKDYILTTLACQITQRDGGTAQSVTVTPLLPGHGSIYSYSRGKDAFKPFWVNERGERVLEFPKGVWPPIEANISYLKWIDAYFIRDAVSYPQRILYMTRQFQQLLTPRLLSDWSASYVGSGSTYMVRPGLLWYFRPLTGYFKKQGLYLEEKNSLIRVDNGEVVVRWAPSPDGCRFFYGRVEGEYRKGRDDIRNIFQNYVIDFCKGESR